MFLKMGAIKAVFWASVFFLPGIAFADFINCGNCHKWVDGNKWVTVSGVRINVYENGRLIGSGTTNSSGEYRFTCRTSSTRKNNGMNEVFSKNGYSRNYNWMHLTDLPLNTPPSRIISEIRWHTTNVGNWYPGR